MSVAVYRYLRILLCTLAIIPVCGVIAGEDSSWVVRMPVVVPLDNIREPFPGKSSVYVADLKRPVKGVLISTRPIDAEPVDDPEVILTDQDSVADISDGSARNPTDEDLTAAYVSVEDDPAASGAGIDKVSSKKGIKRASVSTVAGGVDGKKSLSGVQIAAKDDSGSSSKLEIRRSDSPEPQMVSRAEVDDQDRYTDPSVSLLPSDIDEERRWKSSENGLFFTTPKRFLGLSGKFVRAVPSLTLTETYDSNIDYTDVDDMVTEITPSLNVDVISEDMNLKFNGDFIYRDYFENSKFDRYDYNVNLSGKYKFSQRLDAGLTLAHRRYHNLDQNTYEAGGVELDPTIVLKTTATPEVSWWLTERDNIRISNYTDKTDYERAADSDYVTNVLSIVWGHQLPNEVSSVFAGQMSSFTHFSREIDGFKSDQVSFQAVVGFDHNFSPEWKLSVKGGPGITYSNYSTDSVTGDSEDFLYQVRAELGYRQFKYAIVPALERIVRPGRYGENEVMDQAEIYGRYDFNEFMQYDTINTWWLNETDGAAGGQKHKASGIFTQHIFRWEFEKDWKWMVGFSYNWGRNELTSVINERVKTWMGISYSFPTEIN